MKSRSLVSANITCSGSIVFLLLALVTKKQRYLPGTCATDGVSAAIPPSPGLCLKRNSTFWYSLLKSASRLRFEFPSYGRLNLLPIQFHSARFSHFPEFLYHQIFGVGKSYSHSPDKNIYRRPRRWCWVLIIWWNLERPVCCCPAEEGILRFLVLSR